MFGTYPRNQKGWKTCSIRDVVTDVRYGSTRPAVDGGKYPYLRMNNITYSGELNLSDIKYIDIPDKELDKCIVRYGDVLFNRTNSKELVGKTCVAIVNLPARKMMGINSEGMLISAVHQEEGKEKLNLLMLDDNVPAGAKLY